MTFTFTQARRLSPSEYSPLGGLISGALKSYADLERTKFLKPKLEEALLKAKLYNQYYGPNMESQIGLRGQQASHLGAMTEAQQYENQYLPEKLKSEQKKRRFEEENPFINTPGSAGNIARLLYLKQMQEKNQGLFNNENYQSQPSFAEQLAQQNMQDEQRTNAQKEEGSFIPRSPFNPIDVNETPSQKQVMDIKKLLDRSLTEAIEGTSKKPALTTDARFLQEASDAKAGFYPGTGRMKPFENPEIQNKYLEHYENKGKELAWKSAPANAKLTMIAQANGAGVTPDAAIKWFSEGKSLEDLYRKQGFDPENPPEPDYLATQGNMTKIKDRIAALKEMNVISNFVNKGLGPYSHTVLNYSPEQINDVLSHKNPEKQADFLAARALVPELTNLRLMAAGARGTVHAIKSMQDKSMSNISIFRSLVTPDVWQKAQKKVDKVLHEGMKKSVESYSHHKKNEKISKSVKEKTDPLGIR